MSIGSTAAAADEHQRDDENPDPVVVKNVAKTVVHGIPPKYEIGYLRNIPQDASKIPLAWAFALAHYYHMSKDAECAYLLKENVRKALTITSQKQFWGFFKNSHQSHAIS